MSKPNQREEDTACKRANRKRDVHDLAQRQPTSRVHVVKPVPCWHI